MKAALLSIGLLLLVGGLILRFRALKYRTDFGRSIRWYDVRFWFAPRQTTEILTAPGVKLFVTSTALIIAGVAFYLIVIQFFPV